MEELAKVLEGGADVDLKAGGLGDTALISASGNGQTEIAQQLIQARADVNARDNRGDTALADAKRNGRTKTAALLREQGATK